MKSRHLIPALAMLSLALLLVGCSKKSTPTSVLPMDETPPAAPTNVIQLADATGTGAILQWTPSTSPSVRGYEIDVYSPDPSRDTAWMYLTETAPDVTSYELPEVAQNVTRYYRVRTMSPSGKHSEWSPIIVVTLLPPGGSTPEGGDETRLPSPRLP